MQKNLIFFRNNIFLFQNLKEFPKKPMGKRLSRMTMTGDKTFIPRIAAAYISELRWLYLHRESFLR